MRATSVPHPGSWQTCRVTTTPTCLHPARRCRLVVRRRSTRFVVTIPNADWRASNARSLALWDSFLITD